ncbi:hypothetical protein IQ249_24355 [Lusitaniella coriacea LEGE 07157]|uniref:Uncharacterized protein n=1 Tax=Lusitaniella coriacea LEGE 07157 TaxID=945747 RepID=A0A8J7E1R2_9CYAN|nr:hypothetical protein [Lusitaniella coriacea]MBE9119026.1 hypothetical protein [Lusitaniella coriacea LEGE 07157]
MVQAPLKRSTPELATLAIDVIRQAGCEYGDIRLCDYRSQKLMARDRFCLFFVFQIKKHISSNDRK